MGKLEYPQGVRINHVDCFCRIVLNYEAAGFFTSLECHEHIGGFKMCYQIHINT